MTGLVGEGHLPLAPHNGPSQRNAQQASTAQKQDVLGAIMAEMKGEEESIRYRKPTQPQPVVAVQFNMIYLPRSTSFALLRRRGAAGKR